MQEGHLADALQWQLANGDVAAANETAAGFLPVVEAAIAEGDASSLARKSSLTTCGTAVCVATEIEQLKDMVWIQG